MTVDSNTSSGRGNDPEQIDLIELLLQLWRGKMTIIVAVIIAILLAVGYLMIAKEKWTSTAIITQPDAAQVATYTNALNVLYGGNAPKISEVQANFRHCCKVSDEAAFCLIQRPYISKTLLTRRISPRGSP